MCSFYDSHTELHILRLSLCAPTDIAIIAQDIVWEIFYAEMQIGYDNDDARSNSTALSIFGLKVTCQLRSAISWDNKKTHLLCNAPTMTVRCTLGNIVVN